MKVPSEYKVACFPTIPYVMIGTRYQKLCNMTFYRAIQKLAYLFMVFPKQEKEHAYETNLNTVARMKLQVDEKSQ